MKKIELKNLIKESLIKSKSKKTILENSDEIDRLLGNGWMEQLTSYLTAMPKQYIKPLAKAIYSSAGQTEHSMFYDTLDRTIGYQKSNAIQEKIAKSLGLSVDDWMEISEPLIDALPDSVVLKVIDNGMGGSGQREVATVYNAMEKIMGTALLSKLIKQTKGVK